MNTQQHLWSMTAIVSTLLLGNMAVSLVNAQQEPPVPNVVTAQEFRLVNKRGQVVATMESDLGGRARITLIDDLTTPGARRLEIKMDGTGQPVVQLNDNAGQPRLRLSCVDYKGDGTAPMIQILDYQNKVRGQMRINPNNEPDLELWNLSGQGVRLKTDRVTLHKTWYSPSTDLFVAGKNRPGLIFSDDSGKWFWTAPPRQSAKSSVKKRSR